MTFEEFGVGANKSDDGSVTVADGTREVVLNLVDDSLSLVALLSIRHLLLIRLSLSIVDPSNPSLNALDPGIQTILESNESSVQLLLHRALISFALSLQHLQLLGFHLAKRLQRSEFSFGDGMRLPRRVGGGPGR